MRVLYGGVSYSELMGFPASQLTKDYWFPYYNNVAMNSQLRVSNVGGASTTITVTYGNGTPLDSYTLAAGAATRKNYAGINAGPLHVTSSASNILTTIRVVYANQSYSELAGFPNNQLTTDYWYPYYNNVAMNSQLRVSNVGGAPTTITVTYGNGTPLDSYTLAAGAATRKNYAGINAGPLHVTSSASNILTTVRVVYADQSYSELSGYPANQLTKEYTYPVYDNVTANSQLRVSNVGGVDHHDHGLRSEQHRPRQLYPGSGSSHTPELYNERRSAACGEQCQQHPLDPALVVHDPVLCQLLRVDRVPDQPVDDRLLFPLV